jgi:hypothetical protein
MVGVGVGAGDVDAAIVTCVAVIALAADPIPESVTDSPTASVPPVTAVDDASTIGTEALPAFSVNP